MCYSQGSSGKGKGGHGYRTNYRNNVGDFDSKSNDSPRHNIFSHHHRQRRDLEDDSSKGSSSKGGQQLISSGYVAPVKCPTNPCTSSPSLKASSICDEGYGALVCFPRRVVLRKVECEGHLVDMCISSEFVQDALDMGGSCGPCPSSTEDDLAKLEACPDDPPIENNAVSCNVSLFICSLFFSRTMKLVACCAFFTHPRRTIFVCLSPLCLTLIR